MKRGEIRTFIVKYVNWGRSSSARINPCHGLEVGSTPIGPANLRIKMQEKDITIQEQLQYDESVYLEYGVPLATIPYTKISVVKVPYFEPDDALVAAYNLVEQEKNTGRPGAFVTRRSEVGSNDECLDVITVWGWQR